VKEQGIEGRCEGFYYSAQPSRAPAVEPTRDMLSVMSLKRKISAYRNAATTWLFAAT